MIDEDTIWPLRGMKFIPMGVDPQDPFKTAIMVPMWIGFIEFALGNEEMRRQFEQDTGFTLQARDRIPIEAMVDQACGHVTEATETILMAFMDWATDKHWGVAGRDLMDEDEGQSASPAPYVDPCPGHPELWPCAPEGARIP